MRSLVAIATLLVVGCSTSKPTPPPVDPVTEPTVVGAVGEAVAQGSVEAAEGAAVGRSIGRVAGVLAAVFGGPEHQSWDDIVDRYRRTRDAAEVTGAVIGATKGAKAGAQRGYELDVQFAELLKIEGVEALRPFPDQILVRIANPPSRETLSAIGAVLAGRGGRLIDIAGPGDAALDVRDALIDMDVPATSLSANREDQLENVVIVISLR